MKEPGTRLLGIDPGSHHLGLGCLERHGNRIELIYVEIIHAPRKDALYDRVGHIARRLRVLLDELKPHAVAVEDIFYAKNARSAFHLGIARGAAIGACLERGLKIYEYAPTQVKAVVTGSGRADKEQVKKMVQIILGQKIDLAYDATDAIAVALCHANSMKMKAILSW
jgi:crossover junction endodeoxyribonuclease RuvC